jgi:hypothetical protein
VRAVTGIKRMKSCKCSLSLASCSFFENMHSTYKTKTAPPGGFLLCCVWKKCGAKCAAQVSFKLWE